MGSDRAAKSLAAAAAAAAAAVPTAATGGGSKNAPSGGQGARRPPIGAGVRKRKRSAFSLEASFELLGKVGEGTFGMVYVARPREQRDRAGHGYGHGGRKGGAPPLVAVKQFKKAPATKEGDGVSPTAIREIMLLRELRHPNVIALDGVHLSHADSMLYLSFEYADHDLFEMIKYHFKWKKPMPLYTIKSVMWQLLRGMDYLHSNWVLHRDLKPANIMVMGAGPQAGQVKIADFGLARGFQAPLKPLSENGVVVTIWYRAPELLLGARHYTRAVDIWALGCIFGEMLALRPLFQGHEDKSANSPFQIDQLLKICNVLGPLTTERWPALSHMPNWMNNSLSVCQKMKGVQPTGLEAAIGELQKPPLKSSGMAKDLLLGLLEYDPTKRLTAAEALRHPFFGEDPVPGTNCFCASGSSSSGISYPGRDRKPVGG